jgi:hypothetical protein
MRHWWPYALISLLFLVLASPLIPLATEHLRVVETFNVDEGEFLWSLHMCMERGDFAIDRTEYGLLYYNIGLFVAKCFGWFTAVDDTLLIWIFRALSAFFVLLTAVVCARMVSLFQDGFAPPIAFGLCLLCSVVVLNYGTMLHPDTAQVFFISMSLWMSMRCAIEERKTFLIFAAVAAGWAFSTKYAGIALVPLFSVLAWRLSRKVNTGITARRVEALWVILMAIPVYFIFDADRLYVSMGSPAQKEHELFLLFRGLHWGAVIAVISAVSALIWYRVWQGKWLRFVGLHLMVLWSFLIGFFSGSPQFINSRGFVEGFLYVTDLHRGGHWFAEAAGGWAWLQVFAGDSLLQKGVSVAILLLSLLSMRIFFYRQSSVLLWARMIPYAWTIIFLFTLLSRVSSKFPHYLLPLWPALVVMSVWGIFVILRQHRLTALLLSLILLSAGLVHQISFVQQRYNDFSNSKAIKAGRWLETNIERPVVVLSDKYAYVPALEEFTYTSTFQLTPALIDDVKPDVLVITEKLWSRFLKKGVSGLLKGEELYQSRQEMYLQLLENKYPNYQLEADFGEVKVFKRQRIQ